MCSCGRKSKGSEGPSRPETRECDTQHWITLDCSRCQALCLSTMQSKGSSPLVIV